MAFGTTVARPLTREELSAATQEVGEAVNRLRMSLLDAKKPFTAGIVRAAEEAVLLVKTTLDDAAVAETEL